MSNTTTYPTTTEHQHTHQVHFSAEYEEIIAKNQAQDVFIEMPNGLRIGAKTWGPPDSETRVLGVHGWLDNASTWDLLAPFLAHNHIRVVSIDLVGHGKSPFKPTWLDYNHIDYINMIVDVVECMGWKRFNYMGHSMGAVLGSILAAALPEAIEKLILVDALGPFSRHSKAIEHISHYLHEKDRVFSRRPLIYPTREEAAAKYRRNNPFISDRGMNCLLARGTVAVISPGGSYGFKFRHDPRLVASPPGSFSEQEVLDLLSAIQCPVLLIMGSSSAIQYKGWSKPEYQERFKKRVATVKDMEVLEVEGSHHVHLDNAEGFAQKAVDFLLSPTKQSEKENPDCDKKVVGPVATVADKKQQQKLSVVGNKPAAAKL